MAVQYRNEESDEQLLSAFTTRRDEDAFALLVRRHGPMVLHVCRRVLGQQQDAEDAFQAVFLLLARNAAGIRNKSALAGFLHGAAHRIALTAKRSAARRRKHEGAIPSATGPCANPVEELSWREVRTLLDEEIARLPEKYRTVFVLCHLENLSQADAARRLGMNERSLSSRLAEARKRLSQRLARRGVELTAALAATALMQQSASALPVELTAATIKTALAAVTGEGLPGMVSAPVSELVKSATAAMMASKPKLAALLILPTLVIGAGVWTCNILATQKPAEPSAEAPAAARPALPLKREAPRQEKSESVTVSGRVVDPDGKPVRDARLYLPLLKGEHLRPLAASDAEGRFRFQVQSADVRLYRHLREPWRYAYVVAVAKGYGPGIAAVGDPAQADKLTLRLAKDDVAIKGRVIDLQGKPVAGATVLVEGIGVPTKGDLTAFLDDLKGRGDGYPAENRFLTTVYFSRFCLPVTTGADGRFQIKGIGGERLAHLTISGPTIETRQVRVRARPGEMMHKLAWAGNPEGDRLVYYGVEFEHVAAPTKPIIGVVRDKDTGKPLEKATIRSVKLAGSNLHGNGFIHTVTDKEGHYRLVGMPKGQGNVIMAEPPEGQAYLGLTRSIEASPGLDPVTVDFELRHGVVITGRITDKKTGRSVQGDVEYYIFGDNPLRNESYHSMFHRHCSAEADGSYRMVVPPGHGLVVVRAVGDQYLVGVGAEKIKRLEQGDLGFLPTEPLCDPTAYHRIVEINPAKDVQTLTCPFEVDPGRMLNGTIVGPDGKPLAGARICGLRSYIYTVWEPEPLRTAEFTVYALAPARSRSLLVIQEDKHLAGSLVVRGDEKGPLTIKLQPWGTLDGRLVTRASNPYTKGELHFVFGPRADDVTFGSHPLHSIPRDKTGRFRVEGLVPGLKYRLGLLGGGRVSKELTVAPGETKDLGDVIVNPNE
jgi:RNA polymerase sigma factor (sigma-70 family)